MNFVLIMTDTQNRGMVGAYGRPGADTPNLDRLAADGVRFDRAYTTCPLCTPARSAIFSGIHSMVNGAWANNLPTYPTIPLMGTIFRHYGYRAAYAGKWHLDGSGYFGDGVPGGGFEPEWWYDGKRYARDIGPKMFQAYRQAKTPEDLRQAGFSENNIWGHRVADRALDFLAQAGDQPFVLVASFDEPHGPSVAPPEYWESFDPESLTMPPNFGAATQGKPRLQQIHRKHCGIDPEQWPRYRDKQRCFHACNAYIDREIGRVIEAVEKFGDDDTMIIYTSDHGDMQGAHGLCTKGPMMYEETTNVPFVIRAPGGASQAISQSLVSHLDILPTMLDFAGLPCPETLQGISLRPTLEKPSAPSRETALLSFNRFAINHDDWGEFYPIRCLTDGRYKLAINLLDTDEFYDLAEDPHEMANRIDDPGCAAERDRLHDELLAEMDRIRDPFRSWHWGSRSWRSVRSPFYHGGKRRNPPVGFPFQPGGIEADGSGLQGQGN